MAEADDRPRIAVIGLKGLPATGGGARAGSAVIRRLRDRYDFTIFATSAEASAPRPMEGVRQVVLPAVPGRRANLVLYYWASAASAVLRGGFDLVHVHHGMGGYVLPLLGARYPVVVTFRGHGPGFEKDDRFGPVAEGALRLGERMALRRADALVTVAEGHVPYYEARTDRPVRWIPNGVDPADFEGVSGGAERRGADVAFAAGRIVPLKGCHVLLEAMEEVAADRSLLVMGDLDVVPSYGKRLRERAAELDVDFTGLVEDPDRLFGRIRASDLFVFPSVTEAMSNMLLEVVMCGTPLVCSDIPANRSVIEEDEAVFFEAGSAGDLARKLAWALEHPDEMRERAARARRRVARAYDWGRIAGAYDRLYRSLIDGSPEEAEAGPDFRAGAETPDR